MCLTEAVAAACLAGWVFAKLQCPPRPPCLKPRLHAGERSHCVGTPRGAIVAAAAGGRNRWGAAGGGA
jgi:hypothetical protein